MPGKQIRTVADLINSPELKALIKEHLVYKDEPNTFQSAQVISENTLTPVLGSNLIVNGAFAADTDWSKGVGWTIAAGEADSDGTQVAYSELLNTNAAAAVVGKFYIMTVTVTARESGHLQAYIGGAQFLYVVNVEAGTTDSDMAAAQTFVLIGQAINTDKPMIRASHDFVGNLDNVSMVEVSMPWDVRETPNAVLTLTHHVGIGVPLNPVVGGKYHLRLTQNVSGGHIPKFDSSVYQFPANNLNATLEGNSIDLYEFEWDGQYMFVKPFRGYAP